MVGPVTSVPSAMRYAAKPSPIAVQPAGQTGLRVLTIDVTAMSTLPATIEAGSLKVRLVPVFEAAVERLTKLR